MQIVVNRENKQLIYELSYDEAAIRDLIEEIITNCSVRKNNKYCVTAKTYKEAEEKINCSFDWGFNKTYENVSDICCEEPFNEPFDFWKQIGAKTYSFRADRLINPQLVNFLIRIIHVSCSYGDYEWFINREELKEKQKLELEIQKLDSEINQIGNLDTERKIEMLKELANKINNIPNFNYELLAKYYDMAENCIKLELIQETIKYQKQLIRN